MALRQDIAEMLAGFENRMKFINIVRCLTEYSYPDKIRDIFGDKKELLDNTVLAVLVFIKERTLGEEQTCTIRDVEHFLEEFAVTYPVEIQDRMEANLLARYIIIEILQNGGREMRWQTFNSTKEAYELQLIRLLEESKGQYQLTDDAFDFLFRTKEIESNLDYSVTRFKMGEYLKRNNYEQALDQSRELVKRIRKMKESMDQFILHCRENISKITVDQYDAIISRIRNLLEDEYKELNDIQQLAKERSARLEEADFSGVDREEIRKNRRALAEIIDNITATINEQRSLINKKTSLSESYNQLINASFATMRYERFRFDQDLMYYLRTQDGLLEDAALRLLYPLIQPEFANIFSIENFYAAQSKLSEQEREEGVDMTLEMEEDKRIEERNSRYLEIMKRLMLFAGNRKEFRISELVQDLKMSELVDFCEERALPRVVLQLYNLEILDIEGWKKAGQMTVTPLGEFEPAWCFSEMSEELLVMKQIRIEKLEEEFAFSYMADGMETKLKMSDFKLEVVY